MSDRRAWLDEWCPDCRAAPGARCRHLSLRKKRDPAPWLHIGRGWRCRLCPTCRAMVGEVCRTPSGREASQPHTARLRRGPTELVACADVWAELERRGATVAVLSFSGRAGEGGRVGRITLSRIEAGELIDVERWTGCDELTYALEAPTWDRYGVFAGHPKIRATVTWIAAERCVVISGDRGGERFKETVR